MIITDESVKKAEQVEVTSESLDTCQASLERIVSSGPLPAGTHLPSVLVCTHSGMRVYMYVRTRACMCTCMYTYSKCVVCTVSETFPKILYVEIIIRKYFCVCVERFRMFPQSFEKDDDTNGHIDFITAASVSTCNKNNEQFTVKCTRVHHIQFVENENNVERVYTACAIPGLPLHMVLKCLMTVFFLVVQRKAP